MPMNTYIATFYTHFGAVRFSRTCQVQGVPCKLMPVPRKLSSSCGTCARFQAQAYEHLLCEEVEHVFLLQDGETPQMIYANSQDS